MRGIGEGAALIERRDVTAQKVLLVALCLNLLAWGLKFLLGRWIQSVSMQADGLHSLLDALSSVLGFLGIVLAARGADPEHPYGHSKFETVASAGIAVFIFVGCFEMVAASVGRFLVKGVPYHGPNATPAAFGIMGLLMSSNYLLSRWERRMGQALNSEVLEADALHTKSDFFASLLVIIGLIASRADYPLVDPLAALAITAWIGYAGLRILMGSTKVLTDSSQMDTKAVEALVTTMEGIKACHAIRTRGTRNQIYMDLHIHLMPDVSLTTAHTVAHQVEAAIMNRFKTVSEVMVHVEPHLPGLEND